MPENKKTYIVENSPVDVDQKDIADFLKYNPTAKEAKSFVVDNDTVDVLIDDVPDFLKNVKNAKPLYEDISTEGMQARKGGMREALGKLKAVPSQSSDGGSAMKPMGVELSGTLPTTLKAEDVQGQVEEFAGGELANIDYEKAAEKLRGQNPIQAALKNTETIENPVEKLAAKQDIYKAASSQYTLNNAEIDTQLSQLRQGYNQVTSDFEANKAKYDELVASGDEQGAALIYPVLKEMQDNIQWMAEQQKSLVTKFDDNARAINTINAGRAAEYKIAQDKGELNTRMPMATSPFLNLLGANVQFSPDDAFMASAYNAIAPNVVRTLAAATQMNPLGIFGVYDGVEESLLNVADAIEVDTRKYIPKDKAVSFLDDLNMYNGSELIGSLVGSVAGTLGGGGLQAGGAMAFNAAQGFGGMYGWGREAGLTQEQALLVAAPVGLIYGYLGDKGVEAMSSMLAKPSVKKVILEEIKSLGSNPTKNQLLDVFGKALGNATKGAAKEGFQEVGEFTSEFAMKAAADEVFGVKEEYAKELTLDNFIKGATESFVGGAFGGSVFGTLFGAESKKTYSDVVAESANNPIVEEEFRSELNQLLLSNKLTQEQFDQSIASLENAKEVNAKIPANVTNAEARSEAITLIQEKEQLAQEIENIEPAMSKPMTDRIAEIDDELSQIASLNSIGQKQDNVSQSEKVRNKSGVPLKTVGEIIAEQKAKKERGERLKTGKEIFQQQRNNAEQVRLKKEADAKKEIDDLRRQRDAEIEELSKIRPDLTSDDLLLSDLDKKVERVIDRMDANIPTDVLAVDEAISELDRKFEEIKAYRNNPKRTHTDAQIDDVVSVLDATKTELQYYKEAIIDDEKSITERKEVQGIPESAVSTVTTTEEINLTTITNEETNEANRQELLEITQEGGNKNQGGKIGEQLRPQAQEEVTTNIQEDIPENITTEQQQPTSEVSPSSVDKGEVGIDALKDVESTAKALEVAETFHLVENEGLWKATTKTYRGREIGNWVYSRLDKKQTNEYNKLRDAADNYGTKEQAEENLKKLRDFEVENKDAFEQAKQAIDNLKQEEERLSEENKTQQRIIDETSKELDRLSDKDFDKLVGLIDEKRRQTLEQRFGDRVEKRTLFRTPISESYHKAKSDGNNPELVKVVENLLTTNPQENATKKRKIEQSRESEYQGTDGQQQGGQENRVNQEGDVAQAEIITGGGNIAQQSGAVQEEVNPFAELAKLSESLQAEVEKEVNPDSPKSKAKTYADRLRGMKVDTKNTMYSSLPFAPQIFNGAIELAATTLEATESVIEAFQKAIQYIKDHPDFKKMNASQQKNYIDDATAEISRVLGGDVKGKERTSRFGQNVLEGLKKEGKVSNRVLNQMAADKQYVSRNQDDVTNAAIELVKSLDGDVDAINELANSGQINLDFKAAILAQVLGKAKADLYANDSPENQKAVLDARNALQQLGTNIGQGESYFNKIYELFPELKVDAFKKKIDSAAKSSVGTNRNNPSSALAKAMNVAEKTPKIKNDVFNAIGRLFAGTTTLKDSKNLSNAKTKAALRTLLSFGEKIGAEGKDLYKKLIDDAINNGKQEVFGQREEVKAKVLANLKDVNGRIKQPLSDGDLEKAAEAFTELYEDLATKAIKKEIDRSFADKKKTLSGDKNSKVAKLILYGALDEETTRAKFAEKFGIPYITDEQTAKLEQLANNVKNSKGGAKKAATTQLNNYMNKLAANSSFSQRFSSNVKEKFVDISAYIINNILFNPATQAAAITGNTLRAFTKASEMAIKGRFDILTYTFNQTLNKEVTLPNGEVIKLDLGRVKNAIAASLAGIPRLSEYKLQGISRQEQKIRDAKTPLERTLRTIFLGSAQRLLSAIDASVTPIISSITQYQLVEQMVKDLYIKSGLPIPNKANLQNDVRAIIGFDETQLDAIAEQAYNDVISSPYYNQLVAEGRIDPNKPFPTSAYGLNPNSGEVQLYNEFITRIYEIQSNGFNERFFDIQGRNGFDQTLDFSDQLREIDRYVARNTNEVAFFGRPVGIFGDMADVVSKASGIVPVLKYTGHFPLFINAAFNSAAYFVKMTPLINAIQLAKYKVTGSRGAYSLNADKEFETPYIVKLDQRNMTTAVLSSTILATSIAALLSNLYDTPEEEKEAWTKGNATGFIDNLTAGQKELLRDANGNPLQEGWFYKDGYPLFNYRITPYYGIFNAAAYFHNRDVFERDYFENKIFVEDNPEFKSVLADFMLSSVYMSLQTSSLSEVSKTLQTIVTKPSQKGESVSKKVKRDLEYKLSNLTSNLVPLGRAQKTLFNLYSSADGKNKKAATGFLDRVIMGSLYGDWAVKSNMTDFLGRPIKEAFTTKGLMLGVNTFELSNGEVRTFMDEAYENDEYAQLLLKRNYAPTSRHSINLPSRIELDDNVTDAEVEEVSLQLEEKGYKVKTQESSILTEQPNFIEYTKVLDDREVNLVNEKSGGLVLSFLKADTNKRLLNDDTLTDYDFKQIMNATYEYARQISMYQMFKDELGEGFSNMLMKKRDSYFKKMSDYGLVIPDEFEVK